MNAQDPRKIGVQRRGVLAEGRMRARALDLEIVADSDANPALLTDHQ
ncbi:hypothetical protein DB30_01941 [Enhygromyxa salina]|uniref:Uncharacterized protein n=1 Tax=Enhygromyxa salina TaxID=215803 RepID=A0A0C1ZKL2_9BACT|nr:hypothetical protein [Enhygromyxa salina]KIG18054.1 hypothetical protein DB30_01941 [Enhygromyxa salina]